MSFVRDKISKLDLAFNNVKPKDWYFVFDLVQLRTGLGCIRLTNQISSPCRNTPCP